MERRLTTILTADVAGFRRFSGEDEASNLAALKSQRRDGPLPAPGVRA